MIFGQRNFAAHKTAGGSTPAHMNCRVHIASQFGQASALLKACARHSDVKKHSDEAILHNSKITAASHFYSCRAPGEQSQTLNRRLLTILSECMRFFSEFCGPKCKFPCGLNDHGEDLRFRQDSQAFRLKLFSKALSYGSFMRFLIRFMSR